MDMILNQTVVMEEIKSLPNLKDKMFEEIEIPSCFCYNIKKVKAFVLGADPSNFSDNGKPKILKTVFGIGEGDSRYFNGILENLKQIGLGLEDIYVQNIVRCYLKEETSQNKSWNCFAEKWRGLLKKDFDNVDKTKRVPVLLTTEFLYKFLLDDPKYYKCPQEIYLPDSEIPVEADKNKLERPLIPFYRHHSYSLKTSNYNGYKEKIIAYLH